ncbi:cation diffusion facilitator family transporter [Paraburkholderia sp. BCC1886]|uniref:cation diffusion facilitator family transporter n=1 Tax=Paraburkholderia sp. BCC1886 TaxID=2562670 RepID=UPI0021B20B47|nr:cation diffusion facilitator family transporter [Paraburkholderia sp. BCC1886]
MAALFKAAWVSVLLNAFLMAMQIVIGLCAHSDGLLADGVHTASDLAADGLVLLVLYFSSTRRAHVRAGDGPPVVASLLIAVVLWVTAFEMLWHSVTQDAPLDASPLLQTCALLVSGVVMLAKESLFRYLRAAGRRNGSSILLASAWHARVDAVSALVATLGLAGSMAGFPMLDHLAGAAIGSMIMRMGYVSARDALKQLWADSSTAHGAGAARQTSE